jgi:hypothetical protein
MSPPNHIEVALLARYLLGALETLEGAGSIDTATVVAACATVARFRVERDEESVELPVTRMLRRLADLETPRRTS